MENQYPVKMKALWLSEYGKKPELRVVDVPKPGKREVLIKLPRRQLILPMPFFCRENIQPRNPCRLFLALKQVVRW